ncbi:9498_t:CDS:2 [Gigaspora rosea]|nr:9498_t:CDS:2 [Gigaspora rosea]
MISGNKFTTSSPVVATNGRANQDPVAWLEAVTYAFEANNIQGDQCIVVVDAYLTGIAAL